MKSYVVESLEVDSGQHPVCVLHYVAVMCSSRDGGPGVFEDDLCISTVQEVPYGTRPRRTLRVNVSQLPTMWKLTSQSVTKWSAKKW